MTHHLLILLLAIFAIPAMADDPPQASPLSAAVLNFDTSGDKLDGIGSDAAQLLAAKLTASPDLMLVERQQIDKLFGELELGQGGVITPGTEAKAGEMLGAQILITGRVFEAGGTYYAVAKVIGVETSRVFGEVATFQSTGDIGTAMDQLAGKISDLVKKDPGVFVAKVETDDEFLKRLAKLTDGKPLPKLAIVLTEQHLSRPVIDPAAYTEFARLYQALGGEVVSDPAAADVVISGEAFSERGMQRGGLVACRARVEIAIQRKGQTILNDRATAASIGLGEHVSAKEALEKAARKLLERDLPVIAKS